MQRCMNKKFTSLTRRAEDQKVYKRLWMQIYFICLWNSCHPPTYHLYSSDMRYQQPGKTPAKLSRCQNTGAYHEASSHGIGLFRTRDSQSPICHTHQKIALIPTSLDCIFLKHNLKMYDRCHLPPAATPDVVRPNSSHVIKISNINVLANKKS